MIKVNGKVIDITKFPNMESLIKLDGIHNGLNVVTLRFENESDFIHLYMIKKSIDHIGGTAKLYIPYLPYGRMDRVEESNFVFTLKYSASLINSLNFVEIITLEVHSDVTLALFDRIKSINTSQFLFKAEFLIKEDCGFDFENRDYVVFPDTGAEKRYSKQIKVKNTLCAIKHRDFETGYIKSLDIIGDVPKEPFKAVIIDDLSSRGGTFILTANKLKEMGATEVYLVVAHCENTIYDGDALKNDLLEVVFENGIIKREHSLSEIRELINKAI